MSTNLLKADLLYETITSPLVPNLAPFNFDNPPKGLWYETARNRWRVRVFKKKGEVMKTLYFREYFIAIKYWLECKFQQMFEASDKILEGSFCMLPTNDPLDVSNPPKGLWYETARNRWRVRVYKSRGESMKSGYFNGFFNAVNYWLECKCNQKKKLKPVVAIPATLERLVASILLYS